MGLASTFADVYRFWEFAESFRDVARADLGAPGRVEIDL